MVRLLGYKYLNEQEAESPGFAENLKRYTLRKSLSKAQTLHESFQYNLLTLQDQVPKKSPWELLMDKLKEEVSSQREIIKEQEGELRSFKGKL